MHWRLSFLSHFRYTKYNIWIFLDKRRNRLKCMSWWLVQRLPVVDANWHRLKIAFYILGISNLIYGLKNDYFFTNENRPSVRYEIYFIGHYHRARDCPTDKDDRKTKGSLSKHPQERERWEKMEKMRKSASPRVHHIVSTASLRAYVHIKGVAPVGQATRLQIGLTTQWPSRQTLEGAKYRT